ncbi:peptidyl-prolyl cis-trans isomerase [Mycolicibacter terrae]|uniref:Peptidyl-prolyl cis-trans isomerase n=1 Tax=Mycolicibacter terrae TaxID=1788 RepID=A0AAD1HXK6_9MYCO|nr:peptidylprolyl isomerase [Mycolicibacter terrae]BBX22669.1 peptidyl-prolyl cis-trans isomerase [Mycolicibacter terrae]SNV73029.1 FKBP-type peptidylprolyl isomerase [Mycolicibacter terrae]
MTKVNRFRVPYFVGLAAASLAVTLAGCGGSDTDTSSTKTSSVTDLYMPPTAESVTACPSSPPADDAAADWSLTGASGSVAVTGSTDTAAPRVAVQAPFKVAQTEVHTLRAGEGRVVADDATVSVCYLGVNGRDGSVFDSSYERGEPVEFGLNRVVPGFQKAIAGQKVGSTVAVAMIPADGYPEGQPAAGIRPGDTLVFAIKILNATR